MCYSAQVKADYRVYVRAYGAHLSIHEFFDLFWRRRNGDKRIRIPLGVERAFLDTSEGDPKISDIQVMIAQQRAAQTTEIEQEMFAQRARLVTAERSLLVK